MKIEDANKIIAEFIHQDESKRKEVEKVLGILSPLDWGYHKSLDDLVPVWEKMRNFRESYRLTIFKNNCVADYSNEKGINNLSEGKTIQEATCMATAKAINDIKEQKETNERLINQISK